MSEQRCSFSPEPGLLADRAALNTHTVLLQEQREPVVEGSGVELVSICDALVIWGGLKTWG